MRLRRSALALAALPGLLATSAPSGGEQAPRESSRPAVVIELFTSQGCSSCPAADRVLSGLGREERDDGVTLVPLAFHVDYWNRIGWTDPFSSPGWSARQRRYAAVFGLRSVYTPQAVLNGRTELVGSGASRVRAAIAAAAQPRPVGRIEIRRVSLESDATELIVDFEVDLEARGAGGQTVANLALFENGLVTRVESGENASLTLENDYVVRLLRPATVFGAGEETARRETVRIALDSDWAVANLGLAAFLQDSETLEIHGAAVVGSLSPAVAGESMRGAR